MEVDMERSKAFEREVKNFAQLHQQEQAAQRGAKSYIDNLSFPPPPPPYPPTIDLEAFGGLNISDSDFQPQQRPRLQPVHFTFSQNDIVKSFLKAAEKERQRAEREADRQREVAQRAALQQEYQYHKQLLAQQQQLQAQLQQQRAHFASSALEDASTDDATTSEEENTEEETLPGGARDRNVKPLPDPVHFKFSSHDIQKSHSKPWQKQNIGHWTTFPRSSTQMLHHSQLRMWIAQQIDARRRADAEKSAALVAASKAVRKAPGSAPSSPTASTATNTTNSSSSFSSARGSSSSSGLNSNSNSNSSSAAHSRRSSLGSASAPLLSAAGRKAGTISASRLAQPGHSRSRTLSSFDYDKEKAADLLLSAAEQKSSSNGTNHRSSEKNTSITARRNSLTGGSVLYSTAGQVAARRATAAVKAVATNSVTAAAREAMDVSARRSAALQQSRAAALTSGSSSLSLNGNTASAPSSTQQSPQRYSRHFQAAAVSATANAARARSNQVSPTRRLAGVSGVGIGAARSHAGVSASNVQLVGSRSNSKQQQQQLGGSPGAESKHSSGRASPTLDGRTILSGSHPHQVPAAPLDTNWPVYKNAAIPEKKSYAAGTMYMDAMPGRSYGR
jgi:hypothetical protein